MLASAAAEDAIIFLASTVHLVPTEGLIVELESVVIAQTTFYEGDKTTKGKDVAGKYERF